MSDDINRTDEAGRRVGPWKEVFTDGSVSGTGNYAADQRNGSWVFYFRNGRHKAIGEYAQERGSTTTGMGR